MGSERDEHRRRLAVLLGYGLFGALAPLLVLLGYVSGGSVLVGVGFALLGEAVAAYGLNVCSRHLLTHLLGAVAVWLGFAIGGGLAICCGFGPSDGAADLLESIIGVGLLFSWIVVPSALVINGAITLGMRRVLPMQRSSGAHRCRECGYSLRGLPHRRCPECGTVAGGSEAR